MKKTALWMLYDNRSSKEFSVFQVHFDDNIMQNETLIPSRTINKVQRHGSSIIDFHSIDTEPLKFSINLAFDGEITENDKVEIVRWLNKNSYKPLIFATMPEHIYYAVATSIDLTHNTLQKGYFTVNFECNAPWAFTKVLTSGKKNISTSETVSLESESVFNTELVKVEVTVLDDGDLLIHNETNETELRFADLINGTKIIIDCLHHSIEAADSEEQLVLINDNKENYSWLQLAAGRNKISIAGNCEIEIFWQGIKV